jgi:tetratricopeptide (TPR) repeat protein
MKTWVAPVIFMLIAVAALSDSAEPEQARRSSVSTTSTFTQLSEAATKAWHENRDADAIELYQKALALKPDWQEGLWYLASSFYEKEQYSSARDVLRRFVAGAPDNGPAWGLLGMSEFQTREYARSLEHLERALNMGMGERADLIRSVRYYVAVLLTRAERYDESLNFMFRMIVSGDDKVPLIEPLGLSALRMPLLPTEIPADRRELVKLAGQAAFASQTPQHKDAEEIFKAIVSVYPNEPGVHFLYGVYLLDIRPEDGIVELKRELEISPSHVPSRLRLAGYYLQNQKLYEAFKMADEAVKLDPRYPSSHMIMGEIEIAKGDVSAGIKELEVARDGQPLVSRVHWDLLRAYTLAGRNEDAKREKQQIEEITRAGSDSSANPSPDQAR